MTTGRINQVTSQSPIPGALKRGTPVSGQRQVATFARGLSERETDARGDQEAFLAWVGSRVLLKIRKLRPNADCHTHGNPREGAANDYFLGFLALFLGTSS